MSTKTPKHGGYEVGHSRTPVATRFVRGQSGNPKGRPRGRHNRPPYDAVLGQMVSIKEGGTERRVTAAEAFLLHMTKRGLDGDGAAARSAMAVIEEARAARGAKRAGEVDTIVHVVVSPGSVNSALEPLRMAAKLDRYRETARMALEELDRRDIRTKVRQDQRGAMAGGRPFTRGHLYRLLQSPLYIGQNPAQGSATTGSIRLSSTRRPGRGSRTGSRRKAARTR